MPPYTCPKCAGTTKVISVIENEDIIKKILKYLGLWDCKARPPPKRKKPAGVAEPFLDYSVSQLPASEDHVYFDVEYPVEDPVASEEAAF